MNHDGRQRAGAGIGRIGHALARRAPWPHNRAMRAATCLAPSAATAPFVAELIVDECEHDAPRVSIPRPEMHIVVRIGPMAERGLDVHALGVRSEAYRKLIRGGQRMVMARLRLGAHEAILGAPASAIAARPAPLEDFWGAAATRRLVERLGHARSTREAALVLDAAIGERLGVARCNDDRTQLALAAADRLARANVNVVASDLGVSERHLRRVFRETVGVSPKTFAKLARFERALRAARANAAAGWASIAAGAGYYDQAHLIAEFRTLAGATPRALLGELRASSMG